MMTHSELVAYAEKWLLGAKGCSFALTELCCIATSEIPDAIGFRDGTTILVECKSSRADFLSDKKKLFRQNSWMGMGAYRFYMCPSGVIKPDDLPERWGLVWVAVDNGTARQVVGPRGNSWSGREGKPYRFDDRNILAEYGLMTSALRRVHLRGDLKKIYDRSLIIHETER